MPISTIPDRGYSNMSQQDVDNANQALQQQARNTQYDMAQTSARQLQWQSENAKTGASIGLANAFKGMADKIQL